MIEFFLTDWIQEKALHDHRIGYVRVSSFDQNPERQLEHVPVDRLFSDKVSGKDRQRPELERLLAFAREGDTVVVHSMDRLARNLDDLRLIVQNLTKRGGRIKFVKENPTFTGDDSPLENLMLSVMGAFAEFERGLDPRTATRGLGADGPLGETIVLAGTQMGVYFQPPEGQIGTSGRDSKVEVI